MESADILLSDRERVEGFQLSRSNAVVVLSAVAATVPVRERVEGFQLSRSGAAAVLSAVTVPASERVEGFQLTTEGAVAVAAAVENRPECESSPPHTGVSDWTVYAWAFS